MKQRINLQIIVFITLVLGVSTLVIADEASTAKRLEAAKASEPQLIAFIKEMPKGADLHNHVGGAIYAETLLDAAIKSDLFFDPATSMFTDKQTPGCVPAKELLTNSKLASQYLDIASMRGLNPSESGHDHFFDSFSYLDAPISLSGMLVEVLTRAKAQNLQYMELMMSPVPGNTMRTALTDPPAVDDLDKAFTRMQARFPEMIAAAKANMDKMDIELARLVGVNVPITGTAGPINIRYIFTVNRTMANQDFFARMACGMALVQADKRVVAVNILAPEDDVMARHNFDEQMRMIDFLWQRLGRPNLTLHSGELTLTISPVEVMRSRIRKSIEIGHAMRIGHGVSIAWEDDLLELLKEMKQKHIAVEICLSSNAAILGVEGSKHPFNLYRQTGIPITLNTDDEGVNRSNITMEFVKAVETYGLSYKDLKQLVRNSIEYSFLPGTSLYISGDYSKLIPEFAGVRSPKWTPSVNCKKLMDAADKLSVEVRLERAFAEFEN